MEVIQFVLIGLWMTIPSFVLFLRVFWKQLRLPKPIAFVGLSIVVIVTLVYVYLQRIPALYLTEYALPTSLPYVVLLCLLCMTVVRNRPGRILFTLLLCHSYADIAVIFARELYLFMDYAGQMRYDWKMLLCQMAAVLATFPFFWMIVNRKVRPMMEIKQDMPYWRYLWSIPASYLLIYRLCIYPGPVAFTLPDAKPNLLLPLVWAVGVGLTYYFILRMLRQTKETVELEDRLRYSSAQIAMQRDQVTQLRSHIEAAYQARHDLRHHLLAIKGYLREGNALGAETYLDQLLASSSLEEMRDYCENQAVSALLSHYAALARENQVELTIEAAIPADGFVSDQDLCVVLGNLMENAVEACSRQKTGRRLLSLKVSYPKMTTCVLRLRNSYEGEIQQWGEAFPSSKRAGEGLGIESVRNVAQRYNGVARFEYAEQVFTASVLLQATKCGEKRT